MELEALCIAYRESQPGYAAAPTREEYEAMKEQARQKGLI